MLRLWQMHDELEQYRSVEAIVSLMARHQLRNHQRRKPSEVLDEALIVSMNTSPQEELETKENEEWLSVKLQQLPTTQRTLLYMRQVERKSHEEIATLLGIETTSVSTLLARARRTLLDKAYALMAQVEQEQREVERQLEQVQQEIIEAQLAAYGFIPVKQEDGTIVYINEQTNYIAYEE